MIRLEALVKWLYLAMASGLKGVHSSARWGPLRLPCEDLVLAHLGVNMQHRQRGLHAALGAAPGLLLQNRARRVPYTITKGNPH